MFDPLMYALCFGGNGNSGGGLKTVELTTAILILTMGEQIELNESDSAKLDEAAAAGEACIISVPVRDEVQPANLLCSYTLYDEMPTFSPPMVMFSIIFFMQYEPGAWGCQVMNLASMVGGTAQTLELTDDSAISKLPIAPEVTPDG